MAKSAKCFIAIAYGGGFSGFNLLLFGVFAAGYGAASRTFSVPYRIGFLGFSLIFLVLSRSRNPLASLGWLRIPLFTFWLFYILRIALDGFLDPVPLGRPPVEYIQKAIGMTFLPMFIFLARLGPRENRPAFWGFFSVHMLCVSLFLLFYRDILNKAYRFLGNQGYDTEALLSPITLSYIGAVAVVIGVQLLFTRLTGKRKFLQKAALLTIITLGGILLILGETRSALLACFVVCGIVVFKSVQRSGIKRLSRIVVAAGCVGIIMVLLMNHMNSKILERYENLFYQLNTDPGSAAGGRLSLVRDASVQFMHSPWLGSALEERNRHTYPHNHIVEAFMATGVFGGLAFFILSMAALKRSLAILKDRKEYGWIACLFLVFFLRGLLSYSVIEPTQWYSMMSVFSVPPLHGGDRSRPHER
jgi:O-antigen ligase